MLCEHVGYKELTEHGQDQTSAYIHDRDLAWIDEADGVVAEITNPSLGVGYELRYCVQTGKTVLALYSGQRLSAMIDGSPTIQVITYERTENGLELAKQGIARYLESLSVLN